MGNLTNSIKIIFRYGNPNVIIDNFIKRRDSNFTSNFSRDLFLVIFSYKYPLQYTFDELENLYSIVRGKWAKDNNVRDDANIFNMLFYVTYRKSMLKEINQMPYVNFDHLIRWKRLSLELGEDILTASFFAYKDLKYNYDRQVFSWKQYITSDNENIRKILSKGVCDNHFHLKGSASHFNLSWICLMNNITKRSDEFEEFMDFKRLYPDLQGTFKSQTSDLESLVIKACAIRVLLYTFVNRDNPNLVNEYTMVRKFVIDLLSETEKSRLEGHVLKLQRIIESLKITFGKRFAEDNGYVADYAISQKYIQDDYLYGGPIENSDVDFDYESIPYNGYKLLSGERRIMYHMFKGIYNGDPEYVELGDLFYAYVLIKSKLRAEIVQTNDRIGFENFREYESRKEFFIEEYDFFKKALINLAIHGSLDSKNFYNESRIAPKQSKKIFIDYLKSIKANIKDACFYDTNDLSSVDKYTEKLYDRCIFGMHFIRFKEDRYKDDASLFLKPRNYIVRERIKSQSEVFIDLKTNERDISKSLVLIDVANTETKCRPEVFAQAYRCIRKTINEGRYINSNQPKCKIGVTYHVGEEFNDIVDGLRAIDEAILFLNLEKGDRIGHAIALGVDSATHFNHKKGSIILSRQDLLDNISWILNKCRENNIYLGILKDKLVSVFNKNYKYVYCSEKSSNEYARKIHGVDCTQYYNAMKLRGDNPEVYRDLSQLHSYINYKQKPIWNTYNLNYYAKIVDDLNHFRKYDNVLPSIYHCYHFDPVVKMRGQQVVDFQISEEYIELVSKLQVIMQKKVMDEQLIIETNPSSNYLISTFKRYENHPILNFYNKELSYHRDEDIQIPALINTDDIGVFSTCLENEYALMASALKKSNKEMNYMTIYDWIDKLREMSLRYSFLELKD